MGKIIKRAKLSKKYTWHYKLNRGKPNYCPLTSATCGLVCDNLSSAYWTKLTQGHVLSRIISYIIRPYITKDKNAPLIWWHIVISVQYDLAMSRFATNCNRITCDRNYRTSFTYDFKSLENRKSYIKAPYVNITPRKSALKCNEK